ncbi:MAG: ankyrin repeat domain-containing protein [Chthoniobacterales bacterium]
MKSGIRIVLWIGVACFGILAGVMLSGALDHGSDAAGRGLAQVFGAGIGIIALAGAAALLLGRFWRGWLIIAGAILALPFILIALLSILRSFEEAKNQQYVNDLHSGREDFREQPALLAVAEAIAKNDENAIRAAAKNVPDLNAAGREGKTLLFFAVDQALERPELVKAVEVLLSLGADPNYNNGQLNSFAMWRAVNGEARLLRTMLDAGGNPNAPDFRGNPIIFDIWDLNYFVADRPMRFRLLLDRGADVNSVLPETNPIFPGYSILLFRARSGVSEPAAYTDALELLDRGADFNRVGDEGMTLVKMLTKQRTEFSSYGTTISPEYNALVEWLKTHGAIMGVE